MAEEIRWIVEPQIAEVRWRFSAENIGRLPWRWTLLTEQVGEWAPCGEASFRWLAHLQAWAAWHSRKRHRRLQRVCAVRIEEARRDR